MMVKSVESGRSLVQPFRPTSVTPSSFTDTKLPKEEKHIKGYILLRCDVKVKRRFLHQRKSIRCFLTREHSLDPDCWWVLWRTMENETAGVLLSQSFHRWPWALLKRKSQSQSRLSLVVKKCVCFPLVNISYDNRFLKYSRYLYLFVS